MKKTKLNWMFSSFLVFSEWLRTGVTLKSELPFMGSVVERFSRQLWETCEIFVYAVAYLCSDWCCIFSAIFQVVNRCITTERKKKKSLLKILFQIILFIVYLLLFFHLWLLNFRSKQCNMYSSFFLEFLTDPHQYFTDFNPFFFINIQELRNCCRESENTV